MPRLDARQGGNGSATDLVLSATDGTFFTIDDFSVMYDAAGVASPGSGAVALIGVAFVLLGRRSKSL